MAGGWGSKKNGVRLGCFWDGIELSSDGSMARITNGRVRIDRDVNIVDSTNKLSVSGGAVADASWSNLNVSGSGEETIKGVGETWVALNYGSTKTATFSASMSGIDYAGGTVSNTETVTYPARAYAVPSAPTGLSVVRNSDTSFGIAWTDNATGDAPYTALLVERWDGSTWTQVASLGVVTSWTDVGTVANARYAWRVRAQNSSGYSGYVASPSYGTTPTAPSGASATRISDSQVNLAWSPNTSVLDATYVERWDNVANAWQLIATLSPGSSGYQDGSTIANRRYQYRVYHSNLGVAVGDGRI